MLVRTGSLSREASLCRVKKQRQIEDTRVPKRILVVDDDALTGKLIKSVLVSNGHIIDIAGDGNEAIAMALANHPDMVITDIQMPRLDGFGLVKQLRSRKEFAFTPIIFLSTESAAGNRLQGFRLGADDFLPKPFYPEELILRVNKALRTSRRLKQVVIDDFKNEPGAGGQTPDLRGNFQNLSFSTLLTMIELESKTGALSISQADHRALFTFKDGRVTSGQIDGDDSYTDADAVYELMTWKSGDFVFKSTDVGAEDKICMPTQKLLLEGARRLDEQQTAVE